MVILVSKIVLLQFLTYKNGRKPTLYVQCEYMLYLKIYRYMYKSFHHHREHSKEVLLWLMGNAALYARIELNGITNNKKKRKYLKYIYYSNRMELAAIMESVELYHNNSIVDRINKKCNSKKIENSNSDDNKKRLYFVFPLCILHTAYLEPKYSRQ